MFIVVNVHNIVVNVLVQIQHFSYACNEAGDEVGEEGQKKKKKKKDG